ncbi:Flp pilus assembly protein CpaB [Cryobacterium frigoriphilum]|uniref:Flp pilus assembly protein CpaB n=1 Tax=Cryobacterium frigoriphilum TaxID=1259150 RepID=A0A4R9AAU2_9MICO|nr:RcpC/CpaB family pilus assembly protein [Cryobacterium frigoriphilum]TFD55170.1 Flp pilus assembly protein CpaB [Cryobacterium frigoriphilum]
MKTRLIGAILAIVLAVAGTVVLTGYVGGADSRAARGAELVSVYVVTAEVPAGTEAEALGDFIEQKKIPALAVVPGHVTKLSALTGLVAESALKPGEQLITSRWVDASTLSVRGAVGLPDGMQAVTLALSVDRVVGGTVRAGDTVGVVITATAQAPGSDDEVAISKQVFHKVLVTAVQDGVLTPVDKGDAPAEAVAAVMVTLARTTPDIEKLVWGQQFGSVWLTIEPDAADETGSRVVDGSVVFQ